MAFLYDVRLGCLAMLMLTLHLEFTSAAVHLTDLRGHDLSGADPAGNRADAYVKVWCGGVFGGTTGYLTDTDYPKWSAEFGFPNCKVGDTLKLELWDSDWFYHDLLLTCSSPVKASGSYYCHDKIVGTLYYTYRVF